MPGQSLHHLHIDLISFVNDDANDENVFSSIQSVALKNKGVYSEKKSRLGEKNPKFVRRPLISLLQILPTQECGSSISSLAGCLLCHLAGDIVRPLLLEQHRDLCAP